MASFDYRLNPLYAIKECSSCGALYTADFCCLKGGLEDKILVPKPTHNCTTCGDPVDGLYCRPCAFVRKCLNEEIGVKIVKSNLIIGPTITQKEETYQVILDIIKNTPCYNAFLITTDVPVIYMQQFWCTIKKVKKSSFYQFDIDNKTCQIDVELFRQILNISPRVINQEFTVPPSHDSLEDILLELGYKGQLRNISGIYHKANVDYATLIWEDLQYQIDYKQSKVRRRKIMPYPRFNKAITHYFMSQHKSISKRQGSSYHTVDNDGILDRLKFINKGEEYQVYGKPIPSKGAQGDKVDVIPKKVTSASKKKKQKKKVSIRDESSDEESEEQEERLVRKPKDVVIQDTLQVSKKKSTKPSQKQKLKGIELLSEATQFEIDTQKAMKANKRTSRFQHQSGGSSEGAGLGPEVPDEPSDKSANSDEGASTSTKVPDESKDKSKARDDLEDWGS
ncbi:hypothetical protein Tco_0636226 [Tanacetum coccineum]